MACPSGASQLCDSREECLGITLKAFPGGSDGKEPACSVEDPGSFPGSGRSPGEGHGNPLQYSYLENPMATHSSILTWRIPLTEESGGLQERSGKVN